MSRVEGDQMGISVGGGVTGSLLVIAVVAGLAWYYIKRK